MREEERRPQMQGEETIRPRGVRGYAGKPPGFKVVYLKSDDKGNKKKAGEARLMNGSGTVHRD